MGSRLAIVLVFRGSATPAVTASTAGRIARTSAVAHDTPGTRSTAVTRSRRSLMRVSASTCRLGTTTSTPRRWSARGSLAYRAYRMAGDAWRLGIYGFGAAAHIIAQVAVQQGREVYAFVTPG